MFSCFLQVSSKLHHYRESFIRLFIISDPPTTTNRWISWPAGALTCDFFPWFRLFDSAHLTFQAPKWLLVNIYEILTSNCCFFPNCIWNFFMNYYSILKLIMNEITLLCIAFYEIYLKNKWFLKRIICQNKWIIWENDVLSEKHRNLQSESCDFGNRSKKKKTYLHFQCLGKRTGSLVKINDSSEQIRYENQ